MAQRAEQARAVEKRHAILIAATDILLSEGLHAVTHRQVAGRAGVPVGSIGYYYSSREKLLANCFETFHRELSNTFAESSDAVTPSTGNDELAGKLLQLVSMGRPESAFGLVSAMMGAKRESQLLSEVVTDLYADTRSYTEQILGKADISADLAPAVMSAVLGGVTWSHLSDEDTVSEAHNAIRFVLECYR